MFETKKFGGYLSRLRKDADMTQSALAERLNLTRQAISNYERGDSFPDISVLIMIAEIFGVTLDGLINSGEPTSTEAAVLKEIALGNEAPEVSDISEIANLAPLLKPSILQKLSINLSEQGIDISNIISLAEYLNGDSVLNLLGKADFTALDETMLEKLMPFFDEKSKNQIFQKILEGNLDWRLIKILLPYAEYMTSQIEAAVVEGVLPWEALNVLHDYIFGEEMK